MAVMLVNGSAEVFLHSDRGTATAGSLGNASHGRRTRTGGTSIRLDVRVFAATLSPPRSGWGQCHVRRARKTTTNDYTSAVLTNKVFMYASMCSPAAERQRGLPGIGLRAQAAT